MQTFFDRLFTYRQLVEHRTPLENFTTEIFAFCLKTDNILRQRFFTLINFQNFELAIQIETQVTFEKLGIPDIQISNEKQIILIECKVNSQQGQNQLSRYSKIIDTFYSDKEYRKVVFLTKEYEQIDEKLLAKDIKKLRWFEIANLIDDTCKETTNEFKNFLKTNQMATDYSFTAIDLRTMKSISATIEKMDEILNTISENFKATFEAISLPATRSSRLQNDLYTNFVELWYQDETKYWLLVGFFWWWAETTEPLVGLSVELPSRKSKQIKLKDKFEDALLSLSYKMQDDGDKLYYYKCKPVKDFENSKGNQTQQIVNYLKLLIAELAEIKNKYTDLLTR